MWGRTRHVEQCRAQAATSAALVRPSRVVGPPRSVPAHRWPGRALASEGQAVGDPAPHDPDPQVAANALLGIQRALVAYTRQRVLADPTPAGLAADVQRHAEAAFALLDHGLGDYAPGRRPAR